MYENSDFIETEQPELSEETKQLISLYQKNPTEENYLNLRDIVIENYNAVLDRKETKLAELKAETAGKPSGEAIVAEMEEIVQEMYITYWSRINSSMLRFTDTRLLKWKISNAAQYEYIPVMGAGESLYVKRTPVTNAEYAEFIKATGVQAPSNWTNGNYSAGEGDYPVNYISYADAEAYCKWLTEQDGTNTYRLPNESEWELAAGHMPKDADFNCGINDSRTPVEQYADVTRGAHGAIDFWGNVWEWTSTVRNNADSTTEFGVKGGSWKSERTDCRTEHRKESRKANAGYEDVGFRVIQVLNGIEPKQKVELATLDAPIVTANSASSDSITLSWQSVAGAVEYQIFEYFDKTGFVQMLEKTKETSVTISNLETGSTHRYIVQPISYIEIADNVSSENSVEATCGRETETNTSSNTSDKNTQRQERLEEKAEKIDALNRLREMKMLVKATKIEQLTYLKEIRASFKDIDVADRQEVLAELAAIKEELKDYSIDTFVNGISIDYEKYDNVKPIIENGRTLAPIRAVTEALRAEVIWNGETQGITITKDDILIEMTIGNTAAYVNGNEVLLDTAPEIRNDRTLVPVRFIAESFNLNVDWDGNSNTIIISEPMTLHEFNGTNYWLYTPSNAEENMPLIVYLHGSSGKGVEPKQLLTAGIFTQSLTDGVFGDLRAYVLIPQLPEEQQDWISFKQPVVSLIQNVINTYKIDSSNVSLTGFSIGGAGVWNIAASYPDMFRCIAPCSGGMRPTENMLSALNQMPVWTFVGTEDTIVKPQNTIDFMKKLSEKNANAKLTEFEGASHTDVPALAYLDNEINLIRWLIEK